MACGSTFATELLILSLKMENSFVQFFVSSSFLNEKNKLYNGDEWHMHRMLKFRMVVAVNF